MSNTSVAKPRGILLRPVRTKWYLEFPAVLLMIVLAMVGAWNINLSSCNSRVKSISTSKDSTSSKPSPEKERWLAGKDLFKANCASCHNPKADGTGPALQGVTARWRQAGTYQGKTGEQWLKLWIHNYNDVVDAKYKYGVDMANSRPAKMNMFPYLTDEEIDKILYYVETPQVNNTVAIK